MGIFDTYCLIGFIFALVVMVLGAINNVRMGPGVALCIATFIFWPAIPVIGSFIAIMLVIEEFS